MLKVGENKESVLNAIISKQMGLLGKTGVPCVVRSDMLKRAIVPIIRIDKLEIINSRN